MGSQLLSANQQLRIVVVGLNFGQYFVPIYQRHPGVAEVGIADLDQEVLQTVGQQYGIEHRFASFEDVLRSGGWDATHIVTPVAMHAQQSMAAMRAGLHVACAIPAGVSLEDLHDLVTTQRETGRRYMMMETAVYTPEFLYVKELHDRGEFGAIQLLRGAHYQDMDGWPEYWSGFPPMQSSTHAVGPLLHLVDARAASVSAFGSGRLAERRQARYGNPFPIETAHLQLDGPEADGVVAEVTRSLFETAVAYEESFNVYGDQKSFLWGNAELGERHSLVCLDELPPERWGRPVSVEHPETPSRPDLLPKELAEFAEDIHGGAEAHLVHEFVRSVAEAREPAIDVRRAADWTAPGIVAHRSALQGGMRMEVPHFDTPDLRRKR